MTFEFTYACGHRGQVAGAASVEYLTSVIRGICGACRTVAAASLYGVELKGDEPVGARSENASEVTHLHCADCNELFLIGDLGLQLDGRRICSLCWELANDLARLRRDLEESGQERLF